MRPTQLSTTESYPAVILAGGKSRRMGRDKASIPIGGQTLLERTAATLGQVFAPVYVSLREDSPSLPEGLLPVRDLFPGCGPMAGLHSALTLSGAERIFLCAVDLPLISSQAALLLCERSRGYDGAIIRRENGFIEPLFGVYSRAALPVAQELLQAGTYQMKLLLDRLNICYVEENQLSDAKTLLTNVNTPEELQKALEIL